MGILILATLIQASLQLVPSIFMVFYHYASGKKSRAKADDLTLSFVLGAETFNTLLFLLLYTVYYTIFYNIDNLNTSLFSWIMAGIFLALALASFFFYFRKSKGTELFVSRKIAKNLTFRAKNVKTRGDAFALGCFSGTAELIFTLPLYIIVIVISNIIDFAPRSLLLFLFIASITIPLFSIHLSYRSGNNLAEIQRHRVQNKLFFRFIIPIAYILLAVATINMGLAQ